MQSFCLFDLLDGACPKRVREAVVAPEPQPTHSPALTTVPTRVVPSVVPVAADLQGQSSGKTKLGNKGPMPSQSRVDSSPVGSVPGGCPSSGGDDYKS